MLIMGCAYHPSVQQIVFGDTGKGEVSERRFGHCKQTERILPGTEGAQFRRAIGHGILQALAMV